jgi:hypothetical protein
MQQLTAEGMKKRREWVKNCIYVRGKEVEEETQVQFPVKIKDIAVEGSRNYMRRKESEFMF